MAKDYFAQAKKKHSEKTVTAKKEKTQKTAERIARRKIVRDWVKEALVLAKPFHNKRFKFNGLNGTIQVSEFNSKVGIEFSHKPSAKKHPVVSMLSMVVIHKQQCKEVDDYPVYTGIWKTSFKLRWMFHHREEAKWIPRSSERGSLDGAFDEIADIFAGFIAANE